MKAPKFWAAGQNSLWPTLLKPLSSLYQGLSHHRINKAPHYRATLPVICVGNAIMGGAGKTPSAMALAKRLQSLGYNPIFLSRGYGGRVSGPILVQNYHDASAVGDEPLLLSQTAPVCIAKDRIAGAKFCEAQGFDVIIMDDGFQNPYLHKDINFLVVDGGYGHGNNHPFPAGPLRESTEHALKRADGIIFIGTDHTAFRPTLQHQAPQVPIFDASITPQSAALGPVPLLAFAGLARPEKFYTTLRDTGHTLAATRSFKDHQPYCSKDLTRLEAQAKALGATLVTTEKDAMRLPDAFKAKVKIYKIDLTWQNQGMLDDFLTRGLQPHDS